MILCLNLGRDINNIFLLIQKDSSKLIQMELKDLFTTYWSQITLILFGIGYFVKRGFDVKTKKIEINHSLYQQNRLSTVNRFFENYAKAEMMWNQIAIYDILSKKFAPNEIDKLIFPTLNELDRNILELMIYFEEPDHKKFKTLVSNLKSINQKLIELYFEYDPQKTTTNKSNDFELIKIKVYQVNEKILADLNRVIKEIYRT
jgi:hypothetical protein